MPAQLISTTPIDSSGGGCRVSFQEDAADGRVHRGLQERLERNHLVRVFLSDSLAMGRTSRTATSQWPTVARLSAASALSADDVGMLIFTKRPARSRLNPVSRHGAEGRHELADRKSVGEGKRGSIRVKPG